MLRAPYLKTEDWEAIAAALGTGPSGLLRDFSYYRDAARQWQRIVWHDREVVIARLRKLPFWPQARDTLRKLEIPLEELKSSSSTLADAVGENPGIQRLAKAPGPDCRL